MRNRLLANTFLMAALIACLGVAGCKVEKLPSREQADAAKNAQSPTAGAVTYAPVPTTDDAALVIAACGPAASDEVLNVNDKTNYGNVRRMVYNAPRVVTMDFVPRQANSPVSGSSNSRPTANTIWRFNQAVVDNQKLLTAANIKVYLPCAGTALAKEF